MTTPEPTVADLLEARRSVAERWASDEEQGGLAIVAGPELGRFSAEQAAHEPDVLEARAFDSFTPPVVT